MEPILELQQISFAYPHGKKVLKDFSVSVAPGEKIAVLGRNGAGKSTFFQLCNGLLRPSEGAILYKGEPVKYDRKGLRRLRSGVGLVFQDPEVQLIAGTVEEEISFGPMNQKRSKEEVRTLVDTEIRRYGLEGYRKRAPQYLSGGEKKRVTLADLTVMEPEVLLLDEPTASLDPENVTRLYGILEDLSARGMAILISTHDVDFAYSWADRVLLLCDGSLEADEPAETVFDDTDRLAKCALEPPFLAEAARLLDLPVRPRTRKELADYMDRNR